MGEKDKATAINQEEVVVFASCFPFKKTRTSKVGCFESIESLQCRKHNLFATISFVFATHDDCIYRESYQKSYPTTYRRILSKHMTLRLAMCVLLFKHKWMGVSADSCATFPIHLCLCLTFIRIKSCTTKLTTSVRQADEPPESSYAICTTEGR